ncbi:hypothetical protein K431DRAFT_170689 [Polychaeton citri CBS 116435]|uniref:Uncharacterized protein n=1 Tax=Polychaeton citri CBS 116435 TaxID=1314669 RepID=A0A9P4UIE5_9PEZI|nr:hypothetical protein K431DRAFT_170689 [Polychaeton citri CBS 116435]
MNISCTTTSSAIPFQHPAGDKFGIPRKTERHSGGPGPFPPDRVPLTRDVHLSEPREESLLEWGFEEANTSTRLSTARRRVDSECDQPLCARAYFKSTVNFSAIKPVHSISNDDDAVILTLSRCFDMPHAASSKYLPLAPPASDASSIEPHTTATDPPRRTSPPTVPHPYTSDLSQLSRHVNIMQAAVPRVTGLPEESGAVGRIESGLEARVEPSGKLRRDAPPMTPHPYGSQSKRQARNIDIFQATPADQPRKASGVTQTAEGGNNMLKPWVEPPVKPWSTAPPIDPPAQSVGSALAGNHLDILQVEATPQPTTFGNAKKRVRYGRVGRKHSLRDTSTQIAFAVGCVAVTGWTGILVGLHGLIVGKGIPGPVIGFIVLGLAVIHFLLVWRLLLVEERWMKPLPPVIWTVGLIVALSLVGMVILGIVVGFQKGS